LCPFAFVLKIACYPSFTAKTGVRFPLGAPIISIT
jgi:hypothetical protein